MFLDGLKDAYESGRLMGSYADCAERYPCTREAQDDDALMSLDSARNAEADGLFRNEITPVDPATNFDGKQICSDELPRCANPARIPVRKPAFREGGMVTAVNASAISDGAATLVLLRRSRATDLGIKPRATNCGCASHAQQPGEFATAPVPAIKSPLFQIGWEIEDLELWEISKAFAVVPMVAMAELGISRDRFNVLGGVCALGYPTDASEARILFKLLCATENRGAVRGVAAICIAGGEATSLALRRG